ncbi:magnesium transporter [Ahniella affigens]|uniref:Magnesium transporter MgtE n=1 Tax=Ahniella affigens TaxID=2021234 RepID=A0A2P1PNE6_9GAMM|nr:magnesium transporter [Ahniella affigens]AVP96361.1 magnesium transporter [Ahniella affigens]
MAELAALDKTARQMKTLSQALDSGRLGPVRRLVNTLTPAEIGSLLEALPPTKRLMLWGLVDSEDDGEVLVHCNEEVRESLLQDMDDEEIVAAAESLDLDDLADLFEDLPDTVTENVLKSLDRTDRERLEQALSYPEDSAGRLLNPDIITVRPDVTIDVVLRYLRLRGEMPDHTDHFYVVSRRNQYLGRVAVTRVLTSQLDTPINELIDDSQAPIVVTAEAETVAKSFADHDWISAPVVDANNVLLGRITIDDMVDIIRAQADHNVMSMAGLDEEEDLFAPVRRATRKRALWLGINLLTAFLASFVIGRFEIALEQVVALAILMPVVASMGGIAGTQTLTLIVRGMALGQVSASNAMALLSKEMMVGGFNGVIWAIVVGASAGLWFGDLRLALVIAAAIAINLLAAAASGVMIPLLLRRLDIDPALAGGVVLTTVTDCIGFLAFLGLGTAFLL